MTSIEAAKGNVYRGHNLVFIVGCPRSGTTWLQRLLASHPNVRTGQESFLFDEYIGPQLRHWRRDLDPSTTGRGAIGLSCYFREEEFMDLLREYMLKLINPMVADLKPDEIFIEKTPGHALFIPEIVEMLPESRIIHMIRDPRDVVASLLAASKSWGSYWAPKKVQAACSMWIRHVGAVRDAEKNLSNRQIYEVRYENLKSDTIKYLKDISNFLGLQWDDEDLLNAIENNDAKRSAMTDIRIGGEAAKRSGSVVNEPEGFVRKAKIMSWKEDLSLKEKILTWHCARKAMTRNGYHWSFPW